MKKKKMFKITKKIVEIFFNLLNRESTVLETLLYLPDQLICHRKKKVFVFKRILLLTFLSVEKSLLLFVLLLLPILNVLYVKPNGFYFTLPLPKFI